MTTQLLRRVIRKGSAVMILAGLLVFGAAGKAAAGTKPTTTPPKPAGGGASHGPSGGASHGPAGGASHGPAGGGAFHGPSSGGASHGPTTGGALHGPTTGGATHGPTTGGALHGPTTGGATHGPTTGGALHGPTTGGATHGPTTGGATHGPMTGGATHGPTTGGITHGPSNIGGTHAVTTSHLIGGSHTATGHIAPKGSNTLVARNGGAITRRPGGKISDVHDPKRGMDIHHGLNGNRTVLVERPDHSRIYGERGRPGYVQRPYRYHDHDFGRRSYYYHGHEYSRFYRGYGYRGVYFNVYAPGVFYRPAFYGWAYNPWVVPIHYGWGWGGAPWFGYYGGFFAPYPVYPSAAFWLTDYLIAQDLQAVYAAHQDAGEEAPAPPEDSSGPALTPEVKQEIADEVKSQLALENQEAQQNSQNQDIDPGSSGIARMLADGHKHVFVVGSTLDVTDSNQAECALSDGDVLALTSPPPADATTADLIVLASKGGNECAKTSTVTVQLTDLQEMQNHMRELIDQGLQELQNKQGQGGLPQAPPSAQGQPVQPQYADVAPPQDPNVATEVQQQTQQADQSETDVSNAASQGSTTPDTTTPPATTPDTTTTPATTPDTTPPTS